MEAIKIKRNLNSVLIAMLIDCIFIALVAKTIFERMSLEAISIGFVVCLFLFLFTDFAFVHYTLDKSGLHQHFFFSTRITEWSKFTDISIVRSENTPPGFYSVCFNQGVNNVMGIQHIDAALHPFRYHVLNLEGNDIQTREKQRRLGFTACLKQEEFLKLMQVCNVTITKAHDSNL